MCITLELAYGQTLIYQRVNETLVDVLQKLSAGNGINFAILEEIASDLQSYEGSAFADHIRYLQLLLPFSYILKKCNACSLLDKILARLEGFSFYSHPIVQLYIATIYLQLNKPYQTGLNLSSYEDSFLERYFYHFKEGFASAVQELTLLFLLCFEKGNLHIHLGNLVSIFHGCLNKGLLSYIFVQQDAYNETEHIANSVLVAKVLKKCKERIELAEIEEKLLHLNISSLPAYLQVLFLLVNDADELDALTNKYLAIPFLQLKDENLSGLFSLYGKNTAIGSFNKQDIEVRSFGPSYAPLDNGKRFGVFHSFQGKQLNEMKGWTRTCFEENGVLQYGTDWLGVVIKKASGLEVEVLPKLYSEENLYFTFFVKTTSILIDNQYKVLQGSIDHFFGKCKKINLYTEHTQLMFESKDSYEVEVLPLAGGDFFWGADFLIAYKLNNNNKKFSWEIY